MKAKVQHTYSQTHLTLHTKGAQFKNSRKFCDILPYSAWLPQMRFILRLHKMFLEQTELANGLHCKIKWNSIMRLSSNLAVTLSWRKR